MMNFAVTETVHVGTGIRWCWVLRQSPLLQRRVVASKGTRSESTHRPLSGLFHAFCCLL